MGTYPTSPRAAFLAWCEAHKSIFADNALQIGLTANQATVFTNATNTANGDLTAQTVAKDAAMAATVTCDDSFGVLRHLAGEMVRSIKTYAEMQKEPNTVYTLAQIPPPATPTPMPPPGQPTNLTVTLATSNGELTLRWKCENPSGAAGTSYIIKRKLPTQSAFEFVGVSGKKEFVDNTLFAGPDSVQYTVQGQRSDQSGPLSEIFTVNFGRLAEGGMTAVLMEGTQSLAGTQPGAFEATPSTVDGRVVHKTLPNANGNGKTKTAKARR